MPANIEPTNTSCGRTDFQNGDNEALFHSVTQKSFAVADEALVHPAHDCVPDRIADDLQKYCVRMAENPQG